MQELASQPSARVHLVAGPFMLLMLAIGFIVAFWYVRRRKSLQASVIARRPGVAMEFAWLAAPIVVGLTFVGISANGFSGSHAAVNSGANGQRSIEDKTDRSPRVPAGLDAGSDTKKSPSHRPAWIDQVKSDDGDCQHVVLSSQQYSTREEAEAELSSTASELIRNDMQRIRPEVPHSSWRPTVGEIRRAAVKQQYVEAVERDFGSFVHPMHRVWWQIELSPEVRTEFLPSWRQGLTSSRVRLLGLTISSLVLAASLLAMYRRLDVITGGAHRAALSIGLGVVSLGWLMVVRIAFNHWL